MYTKYYGFNEKPFTLTPNPRFIYLSKNHKEAFAHLLYGINNHYGFIELIGEVGTGKTTVLRTLLSQLGEETYRSALIFNPCLTGVELLRSINHEFGLNSVSEYANELLDDLNRFLLKENSRGITVVLVIDEAQNLLPEILEQLRLISNLETENDKLIQIVLAGQPELSLLLNLPRLRQLNQRIAVRYRLRPMSMDETRSYIHHRMVVGGETGGVSFSHSALKLIHLYSRGLPRLINNLCDRALLIGYGNEQRRITAAVVIKAIRELLNEPRSKRLSLLFAGSLCLAVSAVALTVGLDGFKFGTRTDTHRPVPTSSIVANNISSANSRISTAPPSSTAPVTANQPFLRLQQEIQSYDQNDTHLHAFNAIAASWSVPPIKQLNGQLTVPDMFSRYAAKRKLQVTTFTGTLDEAIHFNIPFLVVTRITGKYESYCIAVTEIRNNSVTVSTPLFGSTLLAKNDLNAIASGTFYLVWRNFGQIPHKIKQGAMRHEIAELQQLLKRAGTYDAAIDGIYSVATTRAVTDFQQSAGISHDDTVGELTLVALEKYYTTQKVPSISASGSIK